MRNFYNDTSNTVLTGTDYNVEIARTRETVAQLIDKICETADRNLELAEKILRAMNGSEETEGADKVAGKCLYDSLCRSNYVMNTLGQRLNEIWEEMQR